MANIPHHQAMIALGGNIGDVKATFDSACLALQRKCMVLRQSKLYQTPALTLTGSPEQPDYLNAVIQVSTSLSALPLLDFLHLIEDEHGRERKTKWGSRTLDLDLLTHQQTIIVSDKLTLPHLQMTKRLFVLQPLADISPNWHHPITHESISSMIQNLTPHNNDLFEGKVWTTNV